MIKIDCVTIDQGVIQNEVFINIGYKNEKK